MRSLAVTVELKNTVGSHQKYVVNGHCTITLIAHAGDIAKGTLSSIERQGAHCLGARWLH
jgi:predicted RNA binding protein YcfA (HicA-like mRNA interferase family)